MYQDEGIKVLIHLMWLERMGLVETYEMVQFQSAYEIWMENYDG